VKMIPAESITVDADVYTAASGKVQDLPAGTGSPVTYYKVGRALATGVQDEAMEVEPCFPLAVSVT
jgi:hypothetical protein